MSAYTFTMTLSCIFIFGTLFGIIWSIEGLKEALIVYGIAALLIGFVIGCTAISSFIATLLGLH